MRPAVCCLAIAGLVTPALHAQNSVFGVRGVGFPVQPLSVRARALGGGFGPLDGSSAVNPATVARLGQLTVTAVSAASYRSYRANAVAAGGLRETRFPLGLAAGPIPGTRFAAGVSFGGYVERTYEVTTADTLVLRGLPVAVNDRVGSDGGIADARGAAAFNVSSRVAVGLGLHLLSGSAKLTATREFGDSAYRSFSERRQAAFSGVGVSVGADVRLGPPVRLAAVARLDTRLSTAIDSAPVAESDLPIHLSAGALVNPVPGLRWATSVTWRSWSTAQGGLGAAGGMAFDTWELGSGLEVGSATPSSRFPLRLGFRYAQLPFSPTADQPREMVASIGTGLPFAGTRGVIDAALERAWRDGAGVRERAWHLALGITVRP